MTTPRIGAGSAAAVFVWALGAWCSLGTIAPVSETSTAARVGVLPPGSLLAVLAAAAVLLAVARRLSAREATPLWLGGLALLPWLPGPIPPAFLTLAGPLAIGAVVAGLAGAALMPLGRVPSVPAFPRAIDSPRFRRAAIIVVAAIYVLAAWRMAPVLPGGDEPHYLVIAQSLLSDGDLRIENNHERRQYRSYAEGELRPDYLRRGKDGEIYSIHAPGLPVLVLPAFAIAGYRGVVVLLAFLSALVGWLAWRAARDLTGDATAATVGWIAVALSVPFFFQAFTIYPDGPAALVVVAATWGLVRRDGLWRGPALLPLGAALAALPWLHTRFAVLAGAIGTVYAFRLLLPGLELPGRNSQLPTPNSQLPTSNSESADVSQGWTIGQRAADALWLFAPAVISLVGWLSFFAAIYGVADPRAPYGHATDMRLLRIPHGVTGLLLDQQFGLIPTAPVYLLAFLGLPALWRLRPRLTIEIAAMTLPYVVAVAAHHMWWGGRSSPARFLVPVLLPAALPIAAWWARHPTRTPRTVAALLLGTSLALTAALAVFDGGRLAYNSRDGFALWLDVAAPAVNLATSLPSLFQGSPTDAIGLASIWGAAFAAAWFGLRWWERRSPPPVVWYAIAGASACVTVMAASSAGWLATRGRVLEPGTGLMAVAAHACGAAGPAIDLGAFAFTSPRELGATLAIPDGSRRPQSSLELAWSGGDVPPGRYRLLVRTGLRATGTLDVALGRPDQTLARCELSSAEPGAAPCAVDLPAGAGALWLTGDAALARTVEALAIQPMTLAPDAACDRRASRVARSDAGRVFVTGGRAYVEGGGLWTAGESEAHLVISPRAPGRVDVLLRNGPVINGVVLRSGAWEERVGLGAGQSRSVRVPDAAREEWGVSLTVSATADFRPADVDPTSRDSRRLGIWLELQ